ncbi:unnamed protein product [Urochloa humidicola]
MADIASSTSYARHGGKKEDLEAANPRRPKVEPQTQRTRDDRDRMSPLYLAIFLAEDGAAQMIEDAHYNDLAHCGPKGQNLLHITALRSRGKMHVRLPRINTAVVGSHKID